jgi:hypothetical protein
MVIKDITSKNLQVFVGMLFLLFAVYVISLDHSTITNPINIDYDKKTFSGNLPVLLLIFSALFFWFGLKKDKKDELAIAKKALEDATNRISGRIGTLVVSFGPDHIQQNLKKSFKSKTLKGSFSIHYKGNTLKSEIINFYEDPASKTLMAEIIDVPFEQDHFVLFTVKDNNNEWTGSVSPKVTIANLN